MSGRYYPILKAIGDAVCKSILTNPKKYSVKVRLPKDTSHGEREELRFLLDKDGYTIKYVSVREAIVDWSKDKEPDKRHKKTRR